MLMALTPTTSRQVRTHWAQRMQRAWGAGIDTVPVVGNRLQGPVLHEAPGINVHAHGLSQLLNLVVGLKAHGEDHQIEFLGLDLALLVHVSDLQIVSSGILRDPGDHGTISAFFLSASQEILI
jgi:hypothetical protein